MMEKSLRELSVPVGRAPQGHMTLKKWPPRTLRCPQPESLTATLVRQPVVTNLSGTGSDQPDAKEERFTQAEADQGSGEPPAGCYDRQPRHTEDAVEWTWNQRTDQLDDPPGPSPFH